MSGDLTVGGSWLGQRPATTPVHHAGAMMATLRRLFAVGTVTIDGFPTIERPFMDPPSSPASPSSGENSHVTDHRGGCCQHPQSASPDACRSSRLLRTAVAAH